MIWAVICFLSFSFGVLLSNTRRGRHLNMLGAAVGLVMIFLWSIGVGNR